MVAPWHGLDNLHELLEAFDAAIADIELGASIQHALHGRGAGRTAGTEQDDSAALERHSEVGFEGVFKAVAVGIKTIIAMFAPNEGIDRSHTLGIGRDTIDQVHGLHFVWDGEVEPKEVALRQI